MAGQSDGGKVKWPAHLGRNHRRRQSRAAHSQPNWRFDSGQGLSGSTFLITSFARAFIASFSVGSATNCLSVGRAADAPFADLPTAINDDCLTNTEPPPNPLINTWITLGSPAS